jgi:hypothetical protein
VGGTRTAAALACSRTQEWKETGAFCDRRAGKGSAEEVAQKDGPGAQSPEAVVQKIQWM